MWSFLSFEIRYRLTRPATWVYAFIFFALSALLMASDGVRIGGGYGKVFNNAPQNIHQILSLLGVLGLFVVMAFHAVPVFRDSEHKMDTFLYAYPISKNNYLQGRFWGSFLMCSLAFLFLPLGLILGEWISRWREADGSNFGPFRLDSYAWPFLVSILPNIFLLGTVFFALVSLTRKMMYAYIVAISFIVLYSIALSLLSDLENKFLAAMLDPFGLTAAGRLTEYWSIAQQNTLLIPFEGPFLWNRVLWMGIGSLFLFVTILKFRMSPVAESARQRKQVQSALKEDDRPVRQPDIRKSPASPFRVFLSLWVLETRQTLRNGIFLALLFAIGLYMSFDSWYADRAYDTGIYPVTGIMLESITSNMFNILSIAVIIFLAGEIVWREKQFHMEGIYDAFPTSNALVFWSKFASLLLVPVFLLALVPIVGLGVQTFKGYFNYEIGLYFKTLILFELPRMWLIAALAFSIQNSLSNKYAGHAAILLYYLSFMGMPYLKLEHPLFRFGSGLSYKYSDMNGFGDAIPGFQAYLLHWVLVSLFLLAIGYFLRIRGAESDFRSRIRMGIQRYQGSALSKAALFLPVFAMIGSGFFIYYNSVVVDHFVGSKEQEAKMVEYEKRFNYLQDSFHPSLSKVKIGADMFPENGSMTLSSLFAYYNPHPKKIDTLWFNIQPEGKVTRFKLSRPARLVFEDPEKGIRAYKLSASLTPGDSFQLDFEMKLAFTGFENESPVKGNGTFFNNAYWPSMGLNGSYILQDEDKRKEYGLPKLEPMPNPLDSQAIGHNLFDNINHHIGFEAVLSTSPDQIAIAPGYLVKQWTENGRKYFHYKMDRPITNFYSVLSARYAVYEEKWKDIDIKIYHHPWHTFNVKKMAESVRHSLEYYTTHFGPYQHKQVRILEFPRYSSFAQSFDNTIPFSEGIGFIANLQEKEAVDYVYFVTAHEMAHQWWGHQILPAEARGAQFLVETMAEYSALMVMKKRYGETLMGRFLRRELEGYLSGRSSEKEKENPLMEIEMQSYAYYSKGSMAMYSVMELMGEERMNQFLGSFVRKYRFAERPYPTTVDFYKGLQEFLPANLQPLADDQLKRITLFKNKMVSAKGRKSADGGYQVEVQVELGKMYVDTLGSNERNVPFQGKIGLALLTEEVPKEKGHVLFIDRFELKSGQKVTLRSRDKPVYAALDPLNVLTDIRPEDNRIKIDWE